jgi:hypothetical protein
MKLIAGYIVLVITGDSVAYGIGRTVEHWSPTTSLPIFLTLFFIVFWAGWKAAIRLT